MVRRSAILFALIAILTLCVGNVDRARGQYLSRWVDISSLMNEFNETGNTPWLHTALWWPSVRIRHSNSHIAFYWLGAFNVDTPDGEPGPMVINVDQKGLYPELYHARGFKMVSKRPHPEVTVDGLETFRWATNVDEIDPDLPADRMVRTVLDTWLGLTIEHKIYQFTHPYHGQYYIRHVTLTNTGVTPPDVGIQRDVTLDSVFYMQHPQYKVNFQGGINEPQQRWGGNTTADVVGDGDPAKEPGGTYDDLYPDESELRGINGDRPWVQTFVWASHIPREGFNILGGPVMTDDHWMVRTGDSTGRLSSGNFVTRNRLHADASAHAPDEGWSGARDSDLQPHQVFQRAWGHPCPTQGGWDGMYRRDVETVCYPWGVLGSDPPENYPDSMTWKEWQAYSNVETEIVRQGFGYGPYQIPQGEEVDVVEGVGIPALSREAREDIGAAFKRIVYGEQDEFKHIRYDANGDGSITPVHTSETANMPWEHVGEPYEKMSKQEWVMTIRDSTFVMGLRMLDVTEGGYSNFGYNGNLAEAPLPPKVFSVQSGVAGITLEWETYSDGSDPDEWVIYRNNNYWELFTELARVEGSARSFVDETAQRGVDYFYYIKAVDHDVPVDDAALRDRALDGQTTVDVTSNKYMTLTYTGATLLRAPPSDPMQSMRVVPNPFNFNQDENVRWPQQHQIGFLDIPGKCTIEIYTEIGELVKTIEHTDGSGDEYWRLRTESNQVVAPGVYYAVIKERTEEISGDQQALRKFTIIR